MRQLSRSAIARALDDRVWQRISILHLVFPAAAVALAMVPVVLFATIDYPTANPEDSTVRLLSFVHLAVFVVTFGLSRNLEPRLARAVPEGTDETERSLLHAWIQARTVRLALGEGAAILGSVVCVLAVIRGTMSAEPVYWINLVSTAVFLVHALAFRPDRDSLPDDLVALHGRD